VTKSRAEERALETMREELASQRVPDLPWDDMERELLAKLDEAPMTSQPRSLDAPVVDVPAASVRNPRTQFARIGFLGLAAAASFGLFWIAVSRTRGPVVVSTASPPVTRTLTTNDLKSAVSLCVSSDKPQEGSATRPAEDRKLTVLLEADGQVSTIRFEPPLGASVEKCVFESLRSGRFFQTSGSVTIQF
jgi:hypothetical protein